MIITYQGLESFKISQGDLSIAVNPQSKTSANVTIFTGKTGDTSDKSGFVITGPGEYEIKDIFIKGFPAKNSSADSEKMESKTTYLITFEGMKLCFLGSLEAPEEIENVDILFVPVNSDPARAYKFAVSFEPSIIIPMDYDKKALDQFIKEGGEKAEPIDKLVIKKKDLEGKESEIMVLKEE